MSSISDSMNIYKYLKKTKIKMFRKSKIKINARTYKSTYWNENNRVSLKMSMIL